MAEKSISDYARVHFNILLNPETDLTIPEIARNLGIDKKEVREIVDYAQKVGSISYTGQLKVGNEIHEILAAENVDDFKTVRLNMAYLKSR